MIRLGSNLAWLAFGSSAVLNSHPSRFLTPYWSSNIRAYADKPLILLNSDVVGELIMGLPRPTLLLVTFCWIHAVDQMNFSNFRLNLIEDVHLLMPCEYEYFD